MPGLVTELQRDALNPSAQVSDLLRKALVVARKLDLKEFEEWISKEIKGYSGQEQNFPEYRVVKGEVRVWNPYHGWIPWINPNAEQAEFFSTGVLTQQIAELEHMVREGQGNTLMMNFPHLIQSFLIQSLEVPFEPRLHVSKSKVQGILETVRNIVLEWSLKLEKEGINGEGMTFSKEEKHRAATTVFNIENMYHSQIQQGTDHSTQTMTTQGPNLQEIRQLVESLKPVVDQLGLERTTKEQLLADIQTVEPQLSAPKPNRSILKESMLSIKTVLEGAAGNILASEILTKYGPLFASFFS